MSSGKGGISLPEIPENEAEKWKEFYSKKLPGGGTESSAAGPRAPQNSAAANNNNKSSKANNKGMSIETTAKAVQQDVAAAEAAFGDDQHTGRRKKHRLPLHRGKKRTDDAAAADKAAEEEKQTRSARAIEEDEKRKKQREEIEAKKKQRQAENRKGQSEFRTMQLALVTAEGIHQFLKSSLFASSNSTDSAVGEDEAPRNKKGSQKNKNNNSSSSSSSQFSDPKHLGIFMQALLANSNKNTNQQEQKQQDENENAASSSSSRPSVLREVIKNKASKPFIWSLLALVHSAARRAPGFLATSPWTLKFVGLCDSFGVGTEKWSSDVPSNPFSIDTSTTWQPPALSPNSLIRQIEEKAWYEYLAARVESLFNAKEVQKFCHRVTQQRSSPAFASSLGKQQKQEDEPEQEDGVINVMIPPTKLALLASKFSSKLLRNKSLFFISSGDEESLEAKSKNIETVTCCIDCLDFLTHSQKELTTLKKVAHGCKMMLGVLGVAEEEEESSSSASSASSSSSDSDDEKKKDDDDDQKQKHQRVIPDELKTLVKQIDSVCLRCQGGASEDEVALASARQLMAVAKFKAAETANGISHVVDEIVEDEDRPADAKEHVTVQGDDVLSAMAVAVNTLIGPPKRIVQFSDELFAEQEKQQQQQQQKSRRQLKREAKLNGESITKKKSAPAVEKVVRKTREEEELDAELEAEMKAAVPTATTSETTKTTVDGEENEADGEDQEENATAGDDADEEKKETVEEEKEDENTRLQRRVMHLLEYELSQGRTLPRRAQTFLDRCRQELRRRQRDE